MNTSKPIRNALGSAICRIAVIAATCIFSSTAAYAMKCEAGEAINAHYQVSEHAENAKPKALANMVLWRRANSVAEQYPEKGITELWERNHASAIKLNRYFDAYERGIEYTPSDIKGVKSDDDWSMKTQLIANSLLAKMTLSKKIGKACEREETYILKDKSQTITVTWLPAYKLVKEYQREANGHTSIWSLTEKSTDGKMVNAFFDKHLNYPTTDYADIGDSESDPFIRKMINIGFIEHGSSGMYDTQGNDIGGEHRH